MRRREVPFKKIVKKIITIIIVALNGYFGYLITINLFNGKHTQVSNSSLWEDTLPVSIKKLWESLVGPGKQTPEWIFTHSHLFYPGSLYYLGVGFAHERYGLELAKKEARRDLYEQIKKDIKVDKEIEEILKFAKIVEEGRDPRTHIFYCLMILPKEKVISP